MSLEVSTKEKILSFRSDGLMYYEIDVDHRKNLLKSNQFTTNAQKLVTREKYVGQVTDGVRKRMKKVITLLLQSTPWTYKVHPVTGKTVSHKISFITLTTPTHSKSLDAKFCHKNLLQPMLRILRNRYHMKSYVWKCELQKNGQIHYHVTTDCMLNHSDLKNEWNAILRKNEMLKGFYERFGHDNPNSTDIHSVHKVKNLEAYLVKYICKEYQNEVALSGKVWDCSKNLKKADYFKLHVDSAIEEFIRPLQETLQVQTFYFERAIFIKFFTPDYYAFFSSNIIQEFNTYLTEIRSWLNLKKQSIAETLKQTKSVNESLKMTSHSLNPVYVQSELLFYEVGCANFI